ncbi:MAG: thioredoxin family protein [Chromatiales bacterium]|nr:thioredoxin family protein [Chromatiales bacterium]
MALTPSTMPDLGTPLPPFSLLDAVSGRTVSSESYAGKPLLVMFICNHCPFVQHVQKAFKPLETDFTLRGLQIVAINANSLATHPQDGPQPMARLARTEGWDFAFLFDETQAVARAFGAACTPDFFLYDHEGRLAYRGQLDDSRPGNDKPVTGADLRAAIEEVLAGRQPSIDQKPSIGCNIKWHPSAGGP